jgi:hypothetical protein
MNSRRYVGLVALLVLAVAGYVYGQATVKIDSTQLGDAGVGVSTAATTRTVGAQQLIFKSIDVDETEEEIKATAGEICTVWVGNTATATRFLKFYNATAANVTVGTTTPVITQPIPGNATDDVAGGLPLSNGCLGFSTAISVAATTGVGDADTGAPGTNDVQITIGYR